MPSLAVLYNPDLHSWQRYEHPVEEIEVHDPTEVISALEHIETRIEREGLHAAGFVSYEAAPAFDEALQTYPPSEFPLLCFGLFTSPQPVELPSPQQERGFIDWIAGETEESFAAKVDDIRAAIASGETYQVNLTFPLSGECSQEPWDFFLMLINGQQPTNCGFFQNDQWAICSASPELFFARNGTQLTMRPMKGTSPRGRTLKEDYLYAERLQQSDKNRAENIMILDMVRNDLGRLAPPGKVNTESICTLEKYPTVWQLTSTATATSNASLAETFKALFPCASITGAPKARTMQIIRQIEKQPRDIYTGTFGWIAPDRKAHFNVAIRTAAINRINQTAVYGIGAGITWDSDGHEEFQECLDKAAVLTVPKEDFALIETLRWTPQKGYFVLAEHLSRLQSSAEYFDFKFDRNDASEYLEDFTDSLPESQQIVRLLLYKNGNMEVSGRPLELSPNKPVRIRFAETAVNSNDRFLFHKTTQRKLYEDNLKAAGNADEVILWNEHGEITEGCTTNVVIEKEGRLVTPPISCGLLPGTYRGYLLQKGVISEGIISKEEIAKSPRIFLINAVRKWRRAELT